MGRAISLFVATQAAEVPAGCQRFASVDGSVPGATYVFDHHRTGELINLETIPDHVDLNQIDGVASTHVDTDAILSAVTILLGGRAALSPDTRAVFETASHYCDHLRPHPTHTADENRRGERLHAAIQHAVRGIEGRSTRFEREVRAILETLQRQQPLPERDPKANDDPLLSRSLESQGRILRAGDAALVDLAGLPHLSPLSVYAAHGAKVGITHNHHRDGGFVYTVGLNPLCDQDLRDLRPVLARVAAREHSYGPPATSPEPGENNWGGRAQVFGSPWNYGSRIPPEELLALVSEALKTVPRVN